MPGLFEGLSVFQIGMIASMGAGLATAIGAIPILFNITMTDRTRNVMLGFAAGVMLAATSFSLVIPAIEFGGGGVSGVLAVVVGIGAGAMLFVISDEIIPETHRLGYERAATYAVIVGFCLMMFLDTTLG